MRNQDDTQSVTKPEQLQIAEPVTTTTTTTVTITTVTQGGTNTTTETGGSKPASPKTDPPVDRPGPYGEDPNA